MKPVRTEIKSRGHMCLNENGEAAGQRPKGETLAMIRVRRVKLGDGHQLEASVEEPKWSPESPATDAELKEKFHTLVDDILSVDRRDGLWETVFGLEDVPDIREVIDLMLPERARAPQRPG